MDRATEQRLDERDEARAALPLDLRAMAEGRTLICPLTLRLAADWIEELSEHNKRLERDIVYERLR